jgi:hypothetical protein
MQFLKGEIICTTTKRQREILITTGEHLYSVTLCTMKKYYVDGNSVPISRF